LKERGYLPKESEETHILSATVSEKAGRWFVSVLVEMETPDPEPEGRLVAGVDLGVNRLAQVSDACPTGIPLRYGEDVPRTLPLLYCAVRGVRPGDVGRTSQKQELNSNLGAA
jgi:transposase